jgi:hypothetical protein
MLQAALASVAAAIACSVVFVLLPLLAGDSLDLASVIGSVVAVVGIFVAILALGGGDR